jgi:glycosyltransferase involved in cell wall biosynthesis
LEIVVVDDGSTDESVLIAQQLADTRTRIVRQENQGPGAARNRAVAEASGDFIQYLDADDLLHPDKVACQIKAAEEAPPGALLCARWAKFTGDVAAASQEKAPTEIWFDPVDWLFASATQQLMMPLHGWLAPREVVERAGPWDERLTFHDDAEYFTRVALASAGVRFVPHAVVYYRLANEASVSRGRGAAAGRSFYLVATQIAQHLRQKSRSRQADFVAAQWLALFLYFANGSAPELETPAEKALQRFDTRKLQVGGRLLRSLAAVAGVTYALKLRRLLGSCR